MVRVAARLIRAENGVVVWSDSYDRPWGDILTIQDDIAAEIMESAERISPVETLTMSAVPTSWISPGTSPTKYVDTLVTRPLAGQPGKSMESTLSTVLFFVAGLGGPIVAALLTFSIRRRATWQLFLAAYLGEILCTQTFRMWHLARLRAWLPSGQLPILTNPPSPSFPLRLLSDLAPPFLSVASCWSLSLAASQDL